MPRTITCHGPASQEVGSSAHEEMQITVNSESVPAQNVGPDLQNQAHSAYMSGSQVLYGNVQHIGLFFGSWTTGARLLISQDRHRR